MTDARTNHGKHGATATPSGGVLDDLAGRARRVADGVEGNPLALVAGGLALGAVVGALLPRSERERALLAPVGAKLGTSLTAAIDAAREAGQAELANAGISRDAAREQARSFVDGLVKAAGAAGTAAAQAAAGKTAG